MISDFYYIIQDLEMHLDSNRFAHTMGVSYTAACLAMRYGYDMNRAYLAGLLHDCAKYMTHSQRLDYCKENNITVIIRGIRPLVDFEYEFEMAMTNRELSNNIETVFILTDQKYFYLRSSLIKDLATLGGDI